MLMGRVPVIISDYWVPPEGPDWNAFSIRVPESDVSKIPAILEDRQHDAPEMARRARQAWEAWFSPVVTFHRVVEWCLDIQRTPASAKDIFRRYRSLASSVRAVRNAEKLAERIRSKYARLLGTASDLLH